MPPGIPQVHLTNTVTMNGHTGIEFTGSSFLIEYNGHTLACAHAQVLSHHFGAKPGVDNKKDIPAAVKEWILSPRVHKGGFFGKKLVIENPIRVTGFLNVDNPTKLLLMSVDRIPEDGNYTGIRLGGAEAKTGMTIVVTTCPKNRKDITQQFYFGEILKIFEGGTYAIKLNEDIRHNSVVGSPVSDTTGRLMGMIYTFDYYNGDLIFHVEPATQIALELEKRFGPRVEPVEEETTEAKGPFVSVSIKISGSGFASPKELDLRAQVENMVEKRNLGRVVDAGSGMGMMEITFAEAHDVEGIKQVIQELGLSGKTEIHQND